MIFPKALKPGDTIGVVATGSPLSPERLGLGLEQVKARGYRVSIPLDPSAYYGKYDHNWSNGSVEQRFDALRCLYEDPEVKAILSARGGYGTNSILPLIKKDLIQSNPKPLIGLSDITPLLSYQAFGANVVSIHGPSLGSSFADAAQDSVAKSDVDSLFELLETPGYQTQFNCSELRAGQGRGQIVAGNLSMFLSCLGTAWDIDFENRILVLEDVGESPFKIHRGLMQLRFAGKLDKLSGLVFGRFAKCGSANGPSVEDVFSLSLDDALKELSFPVLSGFPLGHWGENKALPLGCQAEISDTKLILKEAAVVS